MPPKVARGRRPASGSTTRGGRGRGRGAAAAANDSTRDNAEVANDPDGSAAEDNSAEVQSNIAQYAQSTAAASSAQPAKATHPHLQNENSDPSPNSSPVSIPTETPAPTPARPSAATIPRPPSSQSTTSSSNNHVPTAGPSTRGGRGAKPVVGSRFKPKNIRSDAAKLEEIAKKEQERLQKIAAEQQREQARLMRGRGRPTRGRGDVMGRRGVASTAKGLFGVAPEMLKTDTSNSRSGGGGGGSFKREGGLRGAGGGGSGGRGNPNDKSYAPKYPGEDEDAPRIDIETINQISDDDKPIIRRAPGRGRQVSTGGSGLKPVRLGRVDHKERVMLVNTDPTIKAEPEDGDAIMVDEERSARPASPKVKPEVDADGDVVITDVANKSKASSSPEARRVIRDTEAARMGIDGIPAPADLTPQTKRPRKVAKKNAFAKPVIQTVEDREEYERHMLDVSVLSEELGSMHNDPKNKGKEKDTSGDVDMDEVEKQEDAKAGRLYLFQFPPVLPELYNPLTGPKPKTPLEVMEEDRLLKIEEEKEKEAEKLAKMRGGKPTPSKPKDKSTSASKPSSSTANANPASEAESAVENNPIKIEDAEAGLSAEEKKKAEEAEKRRKRQGFPHEEGWIGKMNVRESGRVELCYGGTSLVVNRGVDAGFLSMGVVVDGEERGPPGGGVPEGRALSMGGIMGKFVVLPDWEGQL